MQKQEILKKVSNILQLKLDSKIYENPFEQKKAQEDFRIQVQTITEYILEEYSKKNQITLHFIAWLHNLLYPKWTLIKTIRDGKNYDNFPWKWRVHESVWKDDNHSHSLQKNIEIDLTFYTHQYNSIENKKRTDILKYYFDFLRVHPFADSNLTVISLICELEFLKYSFPSFHFLKTRFQDGKFNHFFLYEYENNKNKVWILTEIEKMIDDFHTGNLHRELQEKKEQIIVQPTPQKFGNHIDESVFVTDPYFQEIQKLLDTHFIHFSSDTKYYQVKKIIYHNTLHYLKQAFLKNSKEKHQLILDGYVYDTNRLIQYVQEKYIDTKEKKISVDFLCHLHKNLFPKDYIAKQKDENGQEFIRMIPWEYRKINLYSKTNTNKNIYTHYENIEKEIEKALSILNNSSFQKEDILLFMSDFSRIHPFGDGNGRTLDILIDLVLLESGFLPYYFWERKQKNEMWFYHILDRVYETRNVEYFYEFLWK